MHSLNYGPNCWETWKFTSFPYISGNKCSEVSGNSKNKKNYVIDDDDNLINVNKHTYQ